MSARIFPLVLAVALAACSGGGDDRWDDPAVAICELVVQARLPAAMEYTRVAARIDGRVVTIDYTTSALNTRPVADQASCAFVPAGGVWALARSPQAGEDARAECGRFRRAYIHEKTSANRKGVAACAERERREAALAAVEDARDIALARTGIYPIPAERTALD